MKGAVAAAVLVGVGVVSVATTLRGRRGSRPLDRLVTPVGAVGTKDSSKEESGGGSLLRTRKARMVVRCSAIPLGLGAGSVIAGPPGAVAGAIAAAAIPVWTRRRRESRDEQRTEDQLAEAVGSIAAGLRAGLSLSQAIRFAAVEGEPPLADTLRTIADRAALGTPLSESLDAWLVSSRSADLRLVGSVLQLHRRTGGDLPTVLDEVARTLRDRRSSAREIRGYTAQARLSGAILGLLPIGFFLFLSATSRQDIALAYRSTIGQTAIGVGLTLEVIAFVWIRRLLRVAS